ncbi:MAG TPA: hypothetical protein VGC76_02995 [Pyrinomonadaceae bacterium]
MLSVLNLKIYRKLLILGVLSAGLFFASSTIGKAEATDCCEDCYAEYLRCAQYTCQYSDRNCVATVCLPRYYDCADGCYPLICY